MRKGRDFVEICAKEDFTIFQNLFKNFILIFLILNIKKHNDGLY